VFARERVGLASPGLSAEPVTRRRFLQAVPLAVAAAAACGRRPYRKEDFVVPATSPMALLAATSYDADLTDLIGRGLTMLGQNVRDRRVFLKPNMVEYWSDKAVNTDPRVVAAAAQAMLKAGAREVVVGEGPGHRRDVEYLLQGTGMRDVLTDLRLRFVDLNHDDVRRVALKSRFTELDAIWLPVELLSSDYIVSMPKLKTHHLAGMTASMKNLFGTVPGAVYGWPKNLLHFRGIDQSIIDLVATVRPHLTIVDAILAMEGDGPIMGHPRQLGFIGMGTDLVSVDSTCARVIGLDPDKMPYLSVAAEFLGNGEPGRIEQRGEKPDRYRAQFDVIEPIRKMRA
jgi:uncharacterized protein (DUF362 family)